jgi:3-mercaptopyruvate sulfurtransferase SseA
VSGQPTWDRRAERGRGVGQKWQRSCRRLERGQGSIRLSGQDLLEDARGGQIAPPEKLEKLVTERALDKNKRTIVSRGSGVAAAGSYFALKAADFHNVAVYDGS